MFEKIYKLKLTDDGLLLFFICAEYECKKLMLNPKVFWCIVSWVVLGCFVLCLSLFNDKSFSRVD